MFFVEGFVPAQSRSISSQAVAGPGGQVISQLSQQEQHFLSLEALLIAFREAQALFGALDGGFSAAPRWS